ncbi:type II toxin-antitoxin system Phd/YefM family antitoxin [candidate division KSB1 bacterium]|nr:type II toxin-antitoxin system Phd/YefM family antitoxin [candidate division KSB1 bacterium]
MEDLAFCKEVHSASEVSANINSFIEQVYETKKPLILTLNGQNKAVLLDIDAYEKLIEELDLLKDIHTAVEEVRNGKYVSNKEAKLRLLGKE